MSETVTLSTVLLEGTNGIYTFELIDENAEGIDSVQLETLTLTYHDWNTVTIINNRQYQDVKNAHDVTVTTVAGPPLVTTIEWLLTPADTIIVDPRLTRELHVALFRWTWDGGLRAGAHQMRFFVENLTFIPEI
jgi:hypothetical protein